MLTSLAQTPATTQTQSIMVWAGVTLLVALVLIVIGVVVYRLFNRADVGDDDSQVGFSLEDLRILHQQGQLTDDEFNRAREKLLAQFPTNSPPGQGPDNPDKPGKTAWHD